jgi:hypothetical protein
MKNVMNNEYYLSLRTLRPGKYIMHIENCPFLQEYDNRISIGLHDSVESAFSEALRYFPETSGCPFCARMKVNSKNHVNKKSDFIISRQIINTPESALFASVN